MSSDSPPTTHTLLADHAPAFAPTTDHIQPSQISQHLLSLSASPTLSHQTSAADLAIPDQLASAAVPHESGLLRSPSGLQVVSEPESERPSIGLGQSEIRVQMQTDSLWQPIAAARRSSAQIGPVSDASSRIPEPNPFVSGLGRDALMGYAYHLFNQPERHHPGLTWAPLNNTLPSIDCPEQTFRYRLLPLLVTLRDIHPRDLSVLLLMACVLYVLGEYENSICISQEILSIEPNFVEAMNNIGTNMRALNRNDQAFEWWWKAIQSRPTYWDAIDNILGLLLAMAQTTNDEDRRSVLHNRALEICDFVQQRLVDTRSSRLLVPMFGPDITRLQHLFLTSASLRARSDTDGEHIRDYFTAVEVVIQPRSPTHVIQATYTMRELILASFVAGYIVQSPSASDIPQALHSCLASPCTASRAPLGGPKYDILSAVKEASENILRVLLQEGDNALPFLLLLPDQVARLPGCLFSTSQGILPALCMWSDEEPPRLRLPPSFELQRANVATSAAFLSLARYYQDLPSSSVSIPGFAGMLNVNHSLAILFYYLALSFSPSPSTYNNMGIILSTTSSTITYRNSQGGQTTLSGSDLARIFYLAGLELEPVHPHLLTNLGSLFKDQGKIEEAIQLYDKALSHKPDFDIALANMGNAVKDTGRSWDALQYYRRAVELSPNLPEAVCGLVTSMSSVCDWRGRDASADECGVDDDGAFIQPGAPVSQLTHSGLMRRMVKICETQVTAAYTQNIRSVSATRSLNDWLHSIEVAIDRQFSQDEDLYWRNLFSPFYAHHLHPRTATYEGGFVIRFIDWLQSRLQRRWYIRAYGTTLTSDTTLILDLSVFTDTYQRPALPRTMSPPVVPSVLPFNTFTYPLPARIIRLISHRNALRISFTALSQPWLPKHVLPPPRPPLCGVLNIGYVTNDVNNHPLSHLMQSVFGLHDRQRFRIYIYTTSPWDGTSYRPRISGDVEVFVDASSWSTQQVVEHIVQHEIHLLVNLGGYTKGARNDVFAARPCPVQMQLMGYAGTLGAGWCDYLVCDPISCPPDMSAAEQWRMSRPSVDSPLNNEDSLNLCADCDPEVDSNDWMFMEKFIYMPHTFMVTDHKQSFRTDENLSPEDRERTPATSLWGAEELRRCEMRKTIFPDLPHSFIIFANFNQIDPGIYAVWLRILARIPNSILWLLRFPAAGEDNLIRTATRWAGENVASRVRFTDVARKDIHVHRGRVVDLFLDTVECNAHTITADIIWSGTPILTFPKHRHKMCSRVAASMANATGFGDEMVVNGLEEYEERAVRLANSVTYISVTDSDGVTYMRGQGELINLRRNLFLNRDRMPLFDTARWTRNIERAYWEAWRRWVQGTQFEGSDEWKASDGPEKQSACIRVIDDEPTGIIRYS